MLGAFTEGLFKGLEFHEKLYDVKHKRMLSRAADEYLKQKEGGDTKAPLPVGKKLGADGSQGGAAGGGGGGGGGESVSPGAGSDEPQTKSATAADEPRSKPADEPKPTSQKLKEQATGSVSEGDILPGRGYTGLPVPSGPAMAFDATQNMEGAPRAFPTGPALAFDATQNMGQSPTPWIYDKIAAGLGALGWQVRAPYTYPRPSRANASPATSQIITDRVNSDRPVTPYTYPRPSRNEMTPATSEIMGARTGGLIGERITNPTPTELDPAQNPYPRRGIDY